ncbi:MAG: hypothetical protein B6U78_01640 [Candidatus Aenigmarchaeota archaeon ex4484_224]|nr:MAG: hypothetical protein B6U78_01640 [Candidatus Aenigmarchaeota archaeon ex4484_224]
MENGYGSEYLEPIYGYATIANLADKEFKISILTGSKRINEEGASNIEQVIKRMRNNTLFKISSDLFNDYQGILQLFEKIKNGDVKDLLPFVIIIYVKGIHPLTDRYIFYVKGAEGIERLKEYEREIVKEALENYKQKKKKIIPLKDGLIHEALLYTLGKKDEEQIDYLQLNMNRSIVYRSIVYKFLLNQRFLNSQENPSSSHIYTDGGTLDIFKLFGKLKEVIESKKDLEKKYKKMKLCTDNLVMELFSF